MKTLHSFAVHLFQTANFPISQVQQIQIAFGMPNREISITGKGKHQIISIWRNTRERDTFMFGRDFIHAFRLTKRTTGNVKRTLVQIIIDTIQRRLFRHRLTTTKIQCFSIRAPCRKRLHPLWTVKQGICHNPVHFAIPKHQIRFHVRHLDRLLSRCVEKLQDFIDRKRDVTPLRMPSGISTAVPHIRSFHVHLFHRSVPQDQRAPFLTPYMNHRPFRTVVTKRVAVHTGRT